MPPEKAAFFVYTTRLKQKDFRAYDNLTIYIRKHPGISTQKPSELTELPLRSVQRYIAALQATGEWIEYDRTLRGWKLFHGVSIFYGDV